jgi:ketosteroid isomerase-like protein
MRRARIVKGFIIVLAALTFSAAQGQKMSNSPHTATEAVEAILQIEHETMAAIKDKNTAALGRILADDFVYRTPAGAEANRAEFLQNIKTLPVRILSIRGENLKVNVYGETAVLTGVQAAQAQDSEGKEGVTRVAFTDVFIKRQGRWFLILAYGVELPDVTSAEQASEKEK